MRHWTVAAVLAVLISRSAGARLIELDIPYIDGVSAKQRLDIYAPDGHGFATVVYIHGGTPHLGDRKDEPHAAIARNFQASGIAAVVIATACWAMRSGRPPRATRPQPSRGSSATSAPAEVTPQRSSWSDTAPALSWPC